MGNIRCIFHKFVICQMLVACFLTPKFAVAAEECIPHNGYLCGDCNQRPSNWCEQNYGPGVECKKVPLDMFYSEWNATDGYGYRCVKNCKDLISSVSLDTGVGTNPISESFFNRYASRDKQKITYPTEEDRYAFIAISQADNECEQRGPRSESLVPTWCTANCRLEFKNVPIEGRNCNGWIRFYPTDLSLEYDPGDTTQSNYHIRYTEKKFLCSRCNAGYSPSAGAIGYSHTIWQQSIMNGASEFGNAACEKSAYSGAQNEYIVCSCSRQVTDGYCSLGCDIPYDLGHVPDSWASCGQDSYGLSASWFTESMNYNLYTTYGDNQDIGCLINLANYHENMGDIDRAPGVIAQIFPGCYVSTTDGMLRNSAGLCVPTNNQEYCDATGCFDLGTSSCSENWWEQGN